MADLREPEVTALLKSGLVLREQLVWVDRGGRVRCRVDVENGIGEPVTLEMHISRELPWKYSIVLLWNKRPIRRLDVRGSHTNWCDGSGLKWSWQTHKHAYSDAFELSRAYTPEDLPDTSDETLSQDEYRKMFEGFCKECEIELQYVWKDPAISRVNPSLDVEGRADDAV